MNFIKTTIFKNKSWLFNKVLKIYKLFLVYSKYTNLKFQLKFNLTTLF